MSTVKWTQYRAGKQSGEPTVAGTFDTLEQARIFLSIKAESAGVNGYAVSNVSEDSFTATKGDKVRVFIVEE